MDTSTALLIKASIRGVAELAQGSRGLTLHRLPAKYAMYHDVDPLTQKVADQATGARLSLLTAATQIEITFRATRDATADGSFVSPPSVVTAICGGEIVSLESLAGDLRIWDGSVVAKVIEGEDSHMVFALPASSEPRLVGLWLPHNCNIELVDLSANASLEAAPQEQRRWVHYGSSISHSVEANEPIGVWPVVAARILDLDLFNLGLAGSANLEQFAARTIAELPADVISLKVGINPVNGRNMTMRTFVPAVHSFIDTIRARHPETPIVLISPIFCEAHEQNPGPTVAGADGKALGSKHIEHEWVMDLTLERIRVALESLVARREDANLHYLSGLELFSAADKNLMPDGLHPNAEGYQLIGERFAALLPSFRR